MRQTAAILCMGLLVLSLGACTSTPDAEPEEAETEVTEAAEEPTEDVAEYAAEEPAEETIDPASYRPGQALTEADRAVLTEDKGPVLGRTLTETEFHQLIDDFMHSSYAADTPYRLAADGFVWDGGSRWDCSSAALYLVNNYLLPYAGASDVYAETEGTDPAFAVSQAMSWGTPVYTYETIDRISESDPGDLRYGDLLFYGSADESDFRISHVAIYLGQYYLDDGDTGYYQLENDAEEHAGTREGRTDGVKISPFRAGTDLVHVARIF